MTATIMADVGRLHDHPGKSGLRPDAAWVAIVALPLIVTVFDPDQALATIRFAGQSLASTGVFIAFAVLAVAYMKATGAESLLARAFEGREVRMIFFAAALGGLSPFCSCEVIPFIAALLALGAPLSAVMAFWLSSPLMDPAMFLITSGTLGFDFAIAKTIGAVGMGVMGGFIVRSFAQSPVFADPLKTSPVQDGCGCGTNPFSGKPEWVFWNDPGRRKTFATTVVENALFLGKWLLLAYMFEALMLRYIPAEFIAGALGGSGLKPILLGAVIGAPAYLNGYAAVPLVDALLAQGMSDGAAMSFVIAGGVSSVPAAIAVWALVKPRIFFAYMGIALLGAVLAGSAWDLYA